MGKMTLDEISTNCLFRYRDFNSNTIEELLTGNVWHSKPSLLNDPFEFHFEFDWDTFTIENFAKINRELKIVPDEVAPKLYLGDESLFTQFFAKLKEQVESIITKRRTDIENFTFLCCFASTFDNPLMWSHYANGMQGLCIAYKKDVVAKSNDFKMVVPVEYVESPQKLSYLSLSGKSESHQKTSIPYDFSGKATTPVEFKTEFSISFKDYRYVFQKHSRWVYEGEYRNLVVDHSREGANGCLKNIGENAVEAVIFGHRIPQTSLKVLELICRDKGITMYKAMPKKSDYSVILEEHEY
ncbi:TPA: DUF2971 domain-containing protein [Vibrio parahaemolyticus]|nr:DUF2971 domain-containing protein [Vibrio parahaemolyticus]